MTFLLVAGAEVRVAGEPNERRRPLCRHLYRQIALVLENLDGDSRLLLIRRGDEDGRHAPRILTICLIERLVAQLDVFI